MQRAYTAISPNFNKADGGRGEISLIHTCCVDEVLQTATKREMADLYSGEMILIEDPGREERRGNCAETNGL